MEIRKQYYIYKVFRLSLLMNISFLGYMGLNLISFRKCLLVLVSIYEQKIVIGGENIKKLYIYLHFYVTSDKLNFDAYLSVGHINILLQRKELSAAT